ncbi:MAG: zinc ribbon domain-containing protein [Parvibaculum sp.]
MLTGLIHCAKCGGAMTIRTGKGGRYRYYACSMKAAVTAATTCARSPNVSKSPKARFGS